MDGTYTMVMNNKIRLSVTALLFLFAGVIQADTPKPNLWEEAIAQFEQQDREQFPPGNAILFVGSSSIKMWKTLAEDFAPLTVINRGFGGSRIEDSIHFADRIIIPYNPSVIVLYAGDNDIAPGRLPRRCSGISGALLMSFTLRFRRPRFCSSPSSRAPVAGLCGGT